jgi:hypothetical protein
MHSLVGSDVPKVLVSSLFSICEKTLLLKSANCLNFFEYNFLFEAKGTFLLKIHNVFIWIGGCFICNDFDFYHMGQPFIAKDICNDFHLSFIRWDNLLLIGIFVMIFHLSFIT